MALLVAGFILVLSSRDNERRAFVLEVAALLNLLATLLASALSTLINSTPANTITSFIIIRRPSWFRILLCFKSPIYASFAES